MPYWFAELWSCVICRVASCRNINILCLSLIFYALLCLTFPCFTFTCLVVPSYALPCRVGACYVLLGFDGFCEGNEVLIKEVTVRPPLPTGHPSPVPLTVTPFLPSTRGHPSDLSALCQENYIAHD